MQTDSKWLAGWLAAGQETKSHVKKKKQKKTREKKGEEGVCSGGMKLSVHISLLCWQDVDWASLVISLLLTPWCFSQQDSCWLDVCHSSSPFLLPTPLRCIFSLPYPSFSYSLPLFYQSLDGGAFTTIYCAFNHYLLLFLKPFLIYAQQLTWLIKQ